MLLRFASLGSGSAGNATVVAYGDDDSPRAILVDCGFSARETEKRLLRLGISPSSIEAVLITHEHGDHARGLSAFSRRYDIPVFMSEGTCIAGEFEGLLNLRFIRGGLAFEVAGFSVKPVTVAHDAREPVQFVLGVNGARLGILTDLGSITPNVVTSFSGCDALLVEANHDVDMLARGPYPASLQRRVGGAWGHLNNEQCRDLLEQLDLGATKCLVVGHISAKNNCLERVKQSLSAVTQALPKVVFASQDEGFEWQTL